MSAAQRLSAALAITAHVRAARWIGGGRPIGLYSSIGNEVPTEPLRALARARRCPTYLPRIVDYRRRRMLFARDCGGHGAINRLGIAEPELIETIAPRALSVVFVPVLGFDLRGTRLGTGGGYYDRLFAFRRHRQSWHRPLLVGIAYRCQQLDLIERHPYDVPLDAAVTEDGIRYFPK
jgi:5-formyltetrahydrofolate cyclo-ligase